MHDSRIFRRSRLGQSLTPGSNERPMIPEGSYLVGDAGYPANVNILVPYPSIVSPANKWLNFIQSSTHIVVEQALWCSICVTMPKAHGRGIVSI